MIKEDYMADSAPPRRMQRDLSVQQVGTETLIYDEQRHQAFCLNQTAATVWRLADGVRSIAEISSEASFQMNAGVTGELVAYALEELSRDGLLDQPASGTFTRPPISRRALLQKLGATGALLMPAIAAILAPTAAQAYSGCVDCTPGVQAARVRARQQQIRPAPTAPKQ